MLKNKEKREDRGAEGKGLGHQVRNGATETLWGRVRSLPESVKSQGAVKWR